MARFVITSASMGPHFFKCGKRQIRRRNASRHQCFNGAALFQVRKGQLKPLALSNPSQLQWGRTFSSAERRGWSFFGECVASCFNGAALFQVRKGFQSGNGTFRNISLQWGRTFSSAERKIQSGKPTGRRKASMGPHFFKCGKMLRIPCVYRFPARFNGAALFQVRKAVMLGPVVPGWRRASMGPHFFKCGKESLLIDSHLSACQLQWGRTFSSAERKK